MAPATGDATVGIDGSWSLEDFSRFTRTYDQLYSALYSLDPSAQESLDESGLARLETIYTAYPWRGGYSVVNFYSSLRYIIPSDLRPRIRRVLYQSPGVVELALAIAIATAISSIVKRLASAFREANAAYHEIYHGMQIRKLTDLDIKRKEIELTQEHLAFAKDAKEQLATIMGFPYLDSLNKLALNEVARVKILLSLFRRIKLLAEDQRDGKLKF